MSFGSQTVTFVALTDTGSADELGVKPQSESTVDAPGCRHRPLKADETPAWVTDISTQVWKTTVPIGEYSPSLVTSILAAAKSTSVLRVNGVTYQIVGGAQPFQDFTNPFKMTIHSQIKTG